MRDSMMAAPEAPAPRATLRSVLASCAARLVTRRTPC
jgi:hypothetical protein